MNIFIPENDFGIRSTIYDRREIVELLRKFKFNPDAVQFIADMME